MPGRARGGTGGRRPCGRACASAGRAGVSVSGRAVHAFYRCRSAGPGPSAAPQPATGRGLADGARTLRREKAVIALPSLRPQWPEVSIDRTYPLMYTSSHV